MRALIISDITLRLITSEIQKHDPAWHVRDVYVEQLETYLINPELYETYDVLYIHIDHLFRKIHINDLKNLLNRIVTFARQITTPIVISNLILPAYTQGSLVESIGQLDQTNFVNEMFQLKECSNVFFYDLAHVIYSTGINNSYNFDLGHLYQMPYTKNVIKDIGTTLYKFLQRISKPDKKLIIVDCDNTLWGGIVGEDGIDKIKCNLNADGILYYHFQQFLLLKKEEGFLLAICSKNNEEDVKQAFANNSMPLKWDDFIYKAINWTNKADNIANIVKDLNLGYESTIFIDDSMFELASIRELIPEVSLFHFSNEYTKFIKLTEDILFRKKHLTAEDQDKTTQYRQEKERQTLSASLNSMEAYIASLNIVLEIKENSISDLARLAQLTEKTNQFNFNKKPYSIQELQYAVNTNKLKLFSLSASDKFGDYGIVGLIIIEITDDTLILDNFILSCRALGRNIEIDFWLKVKKSLLEKYGKSIHLIRFKKTDKNLPASSFIEKYKELL